MNDELIIEPCVSMGPIHLGMTMADCEGILGPPPDLFQRTEDSPEKILAYDDLFLHVTISSNGYVIEISAFQPRKVYLSGIQLLGRPLPEVKKNLAFCMPIQEIDVGLYCKDAGVVLVEVDNIIDGVELRHPDN